MKIMNHKIFLTALLVISLLIFTGCTEKTITGNLDKSFQGSIDSIEESGTLHVECSKVIVEKNSEGITDTFSRLCSVKVNKGTIIIGKDGNILDKKLLEVGQIVDVVLEKPKDINENLNSRKVVAKEIKVLEEINY
jgi:hypothetical protein